MIDKVEIHLKNTNQKKHVPVGTSLEEIIEIFDFKMPYLIANAKVNNRIESLAYKVYHPKQVEFADITSQSAMRTYVRSLCFILTKAVNDVLPEATTYIEHAVSKGYFFYIEINGETDIVTDSQLDDIQNRMREIVEADHPFISYEDETEKVVKLFREKEMEDKALLLETSDFIYSRYFELDGYINYFHGSLTPSTGYISIFDIMRYNGGFLLQIPNRTTPYKIDSFVRQDKMLNSYREQLQYLKMAKLNNVGDLNKAKQKNHISTVIQIAEAFQSQQIGDIAKEIANRYKDGARIILISGPTSSGKTTFRKRLEVQLMVNMLKPVGISLDDYFVNRVDTPKDKNGDYDYESLYALDLPLLEKDMLALTAGEEVNMPIYNFTTGKREYNNNRLKIDPNDVIIVEGIHALNPKLTSRIPEDKKFMIYVSALTSISLDNHNWIPASDNRLLRRITRDYNYRNYSAIDTISRWDKVRRGEEKWIFPFQENADVMFNSAMIYELGSIRKHVEPILQQVPRKAPEYAEAHRLLKLLSFFNYITDSELPPTSLLREFVGGSSFIY